MCRWVRSVARESVGALTLAGPGWRAALIAGGLLMALPATAQDRTGGGDAEAEERPWYFSFGASYGFLNDNGVGPETNPQGVLAHDSGYGVGLALGYAWERVRVEASYTFSNNSASKMIRTDGFSRATGEIQTNAYMVNGYYEFPELRDYWITPYIGGGIGVVSVVAEEIQVLEDTPFLDRGVVIDDAQPAFGYQLMLGTAIHLSKRTTLDVGYRYMHTMEVELNHSVQAAATTSFDPMHFHNFDVRLRVAF